MIDREDLFVGGREKKPQCRVCVDTFKNVTFAWRLQEATEGNSRKVVRTLLSE